jgi:hypothetical protein
LADPSDKNSASNQAHSQSRKPVSEMLTPEEQASLRQHAKELNDFAYQAFAHLRKKPAT